MCDDVKVVSLSGERCRTGAGSGTEKWGSKRVLALVSEARADGTDASDEDDEDDGDDVLADNFAATTR